VGQQEYESRQNQKKPHLQNRCDSENYDNRAIISFLILEIMSKIEFFTTREAMAHWRRNFFILAMALYGYGVAVPAAAHAKCDKSETEMLKFALDHAPSDFSAIKGDSAGGGQYNLNTKFCPDSFTLQYRPAGDQYPENWALSFDLPYDGAPTDAADFIVKEFLPILTPRGYPPKPTMYPTEHDDVYFEWGGPSHVWISVTIVEKNSASNLTVKVSHASM
jgi:hypothetical protein